MARSGQPRDLAAPKVLKGRLDLLENREQRDHKALKDRMDRMEYRALKENLALSDLLVRLECAVASAGELWYQKTTTLKWMIITLGLIVLDRLLSHFPQIASLVAKLL
jgi:hypothetical protein